MVSFPQLNLNRFRFSKKTYLLLALIILVLLLVLLSVDFGHENVDPDQLLNSSLQNTLAAQSYRYNIECILGENKEPVSKIEGARVGDSKIHIKGLLINSPVEFVQYEDNTYMKDPFTGKWLTLQGNQLAKAESFIMEFNPLANFNFKDVPVLEYVGKEKVDGKEMYVLELQPNIEIPFLENQFNSFNYKLWINPDDQRIHQARINAGHTANARAVMQINIKLYDFNEKIDIKPPL